MGIIALSCGSFNLIIMKIDQSLLSKLEEFIDKEKIPRTIFYFQ